MDCAVGSQTLLDSFSEEWFYPYINPRFNYSDSHAHQRKIIRSCIALSWWFLLVFLVTIQDNREALINTKITLQVYAVYSLLMGAAFLFMAGKVLDGMGVMDPSDLIIST